MRLILGPRITEKSTRIGDAHRQVVFRVVQEATKPEIKKAVERMFKVEVDRVRVLNMKGKRKGFARREGRRSDWKKAYVTLKSGHDIDFMARE